MSDGAIASITAALITITTMVIGFMTLWVKLKYGVKTAESVETKVDHNTAMTERIEQQTNGVLTTRLDQLDEHASRILTLEKDVAAIKNSLDGLVSTLSSTRHELRGQLQVISNGMNLLMAANPKLVEVREKVEGK